MEDNDNSTPNNSDTTSHSTMEMETIINSHTVDLQVGGSKHTHIKLRHNSSIPISIGDYVVEGALPKINNQNTVIMRAASNPSNGCPDLMLMHNTRIFYFERDAIQQTKQIECVPLDLAADQMTNNINDMLMTPKYRSLSAFYLSFHLLDHTILVSIILSLFTGENSYLSFGGVFLKHWELFAVIALEAVYGVLEYNVRVWILNRVAFYFVFTLYGLYCAVVTWNDMWDISVIVLLSVRFASFLCELLVDFFIDLELHHDLKVQKIHSMPVKFICRSFCGNIGYELKDEHDLINNIPSGWRYKGSIWSSTPLNAFKIGVDELRTEELSDSHRYVFEVMVIFTIIVTLPVTIIVGMIMGILSLLKSCCCCKDIKYDDTIFAECTRNSSW